MNFAWFLHGAKRSPQQSAFDTVDALLPGLASAPLASTSAALWADRAPTSSPRRQHCERLVDTLSTVAAFICTHASRTLYPTQPENSNALPGFQMSDQIAI